MYCLAGPDDHSLLSHASQAQKAVPTLEPADPRHRAAPPEFPPPGMCKEPYQPLYHNLYYIHIQEMILTITRMMMMMMVEKGRQM